MTERAAIYCRISEDPRALEKGVTRQAEDCAALIRSRGWQLVGTWTDNDVAVLRSGAHRSRYAAMPAAAERGEITRIVAYGLSRLWRSRTERAAAIARLSRLRVRIALVKGPTWTFQRGWAYVCRAETCWSTSSEQPSQD